jgi:hypothetical protein
MILKNYKTYQNIFKNFGQKLFLLMVVFFVSVLSSFNVSAQTDQGNKIWDESNTELSITAPINTVEVDQNFYLRFTQNIDSFEKTSNISWNVDKISGVNAYHREVNSNKDNNEAVKIAEPGNYIISLNLNIDSSNIKTTKKLKVLPKNSEYFNGLIINEIDFNNSKIELHNNSNRDLDTSNLFLTYNTADKYSVAKIESIPSKSYAVYDLSPKVENLSNIRLVFVKNNKEAFEVSQVSLSDPKFANNLNKTAQLNQDKNIWELANPTLGQNNVFDVNISANTLIKTNSEIDSKSDTKFNRTQVIRTGGQDNQILILIPFLIISLFYILSLVLENLDLKYFVAKLRFYFKESAETYLDLGYLKLVEMNLSLKFKITFLSRSCINTARINAILNSLVLDRIAI